MHRKFIQPNRPPLPQPHHAKPNEFPVNEWNLLTLGKRVSVSRRAWFTAWSLTNRAPGDVRSGWRRRRQLKLRHLVENLADAAAAQIGRHFSVKSHSNFYLYDFTRDKLLLRMLEQTNEFSWYEFVIKNSLFVRIVDFVKTIWLDIEFAKAKFVCRCRIP